VEIDDTLEFVCPVTGRHWESRPEWVIAGPRSTYRFYVLERRIVMCRSFGSTGREEVGWYCAALEKILQEFHEPGIPMVLIEDYTQLHSSDNGARQLYSEFHLRRQDIWRGVLFYGMNPFLKLLMRLTKRLYPLRMTVDVCGSYAQSLSRAFQILGLPLQAASVEEQRSESTWTSPNMTVVFHPLDSNNILRVVPRGRVLASEIPAIFRAYETFLAAQSPPPGQWCRFVDYSGVIDWEVMGLILTLRHFRRIDLLFPPRRKFVAHPPSGIVSLVAISWLRWIGSTELVRDSREIVSRIAWMQQTEHEESKAYRLHDRIRRIFERSRSRTAQDLQTFISELQWDVVGVPRNPYESSDPMHQVAASLLVVKSDFDELLVERDRREYELDAARRRAEEVNRLQARFLANVSHEIRTPLNAVMGLGELIADTALDARQEDLLRMLRQSAHGLLAVINDILDLSRMEAGEFRLVEEPFDLGAVLDEVDSMIGLLASKRGLVFQMERAWDLPSGLRGDAVRLRQVLVNLAGNAVKFTEEGVVAIRVRGEAVPERNASRLRIEVEDSGPGIPSDKIEELFRAFKQLDGSFTRRHGGTGLGLAIARNLAERMGGEITVHPAPVRGTIFRFEALFEHAEPPIHSDGGGDSGVVLDGRVLLAEDNVVNQKVALGLLAKLGIDAVAVDNGRAVLDILSARSGEFRCILMDIQMPVMDGMEAARRIRLGEAGEAERRIPIFALTAHAMDGDREAFLEAGMDGYLSKPIRFATLRATLENVLAKSAESTSED